MKIGEILRAIPLDHTTIIYNIKCAKNHYAREDEFKNWYNELRGSKFESSWEQKCVEIKKSLIEINSN